MKIRCPKCGKIREICHCEHGITHSCSCDEVFELNDETIIQEYSLVDEKMPEKIGRFPVIRLIGCGGMCGVYECTHPDLGIRVAVKVPLPEFLNDIQFCQRFENSAKICAGINHPNIVKIYEFGTDMMSKRPFLVMEYIGGGTLFDLLKKHGIFSARETILIARAICLGLIEAERHGIVHRDIKPDNILISNDGQYKLSDLGLAKQNHIREEKNATILTENKQNITGNMYSLGTLEFMPPEQLLNAASCDSRADIYSLGVTLYQLSTSHLPIECDDKELFRRLLLVKEPKVPSFYEKELPLDFDYIVMTCLPKNRKKRYQTFQELLQDLNAFLENKTLPSCNHEPEILDLRPETSSKKKNIILIGIAFGIFLAIIILSALIIFLEIKHTDDKNVSNIPANHNSSEQQVSSRNSITNSNMEKTSEIIITETETENEIDFYQKAMNNAKKAINEKNNFLFAEEQLSGFIKIAKNADNILSAQRKLEELKEYKEKTVAELIQSLKKEADSLVSEGKIKEAIFIFEDYHGSLSKESLNERNLEIEKIKDNVHKIELHPINNNL